MSDIEDYLDSIRGLTDGHETVIDPRRPGDVQAFRDYAAGQRVVIEVEEEEEDPR